MEEKEKEEIKKEILKDDLFCKKCGKDFTEKKKEEQCPPCQQET